MLMSAGPPMAGGYVRGHLAPATSGDNVLITTPGPHPQPTPSANWLLTWSMNDIWHLGEMMKSYVSPVYNIHLVTHKTLEYNLDETSDEEK